VKFKTPPPLKVVVLDTNVELTPGSTQVAKLLSPPQPDTNYAVMCSFSYATTYYITGKVLDSFIIHYGAAPAGATMDVLVVRKI